MINFLGQCQQALTVIFVEYGELFIVFL